MPGFEIFGDEELWLLDIPEISFSQAIIGRSGFIKLWDDPVQNVIPNWSPAENKFVFGGGIFGVEIYDLEAKERKWLLKPRASSGWYHPNWSPSGKWIALDRSYETPSLMIVSSDGKYYEATGDCYFLDKQWAPKNDNLAYLCSTNQSESISLWILNISETVEDAQ